MHVHCTDAEVFGPVKPNVPDWHGMLLMLILAEVDPLVKFPCDGEKFPPTLLLDDQPRLPAGLSESVTVQL